MKELHLRGKRSKNGKYHSYKGEVGKVADNLLHRDFSAEKPFEKLATDVTEFKIGEEKVYFSPVLDMFNREIVRSEEESCKGSIKRWERIFLEEGAEGLMKERRGKSYGSKKSRPPKLDKKVEEDLIAENQRLRMEIEYLKKLSALVLAEEQKNGKKRS